MVLRGVEEFRRKFSKLKKQKVCLSPGVYSHLLRSLEEELSLKIDSLRGQSEQTRADFLVAIYREDNKFVKRKYEVYFLKKIFLVEYISKGQKMGITFDKFERVKELLDAKNEMIS